MKARGIILCDFEFPGFREAAEMQDKMDEAGKLRTEGNKYVVHTQVDRKERRGDHAADIKKMKFRNN